MKSTTRFSKNERGIECLNCKQPISNKDNFCSECGQVNDLQRVSIKQFITEFFAGFFSFDTRFFKTIVPLLLKPGKVSKEYIEGKRKKYVNPFQLYLNVTIVFFLLLGLFSAVDEYNVSDDVMTNNNEVVSDSTQFAIIVESPKTNNKILTLRLDSIFNNTNFLDYFRNDSISIAKKDSIYNEFQSSNMDFIVEMITNDTKGDYGKFGQIPTYNNFAITYTNDIFKTDSINYTPPAKNQSSSDVKQLNRQFGKALVEKISAFQKYDEEHKNASAMQAMTELNYKKTRWNAFYFKTAQNLNKAKVDKEFGKSWGKAIISKTSIALFFLLPIFTLFLSLLYIRRKWNYTEHLVFVFNVQTVFFLMMILFMFFDRIFNTNAGIALFFPVFLFYLFRALRNFYGQHWFKTTVKFFLLNTFYVILSVIGLIVVAFIAFLI